MKYFSTFSGIGGFELAITQAYEICNANGGQNRRGEKDTQGDQGQGFQPTQGKEVSTEKRPISECDNNVINQRPLCVGYSEIDKYAIQVYQKQFPNHKNYGDITRINEKELPDFDLFVGGFPCQAFSIAGKRKGFADTRGTLFFEIERIIREKQPRLLLLENVKGLLSHDKGHTFYTIISTLDELGYDCQWQVLNSKNFGVPQNRERVFIVGHLRGTSRPEIFPFGKSDESLQNFKSGRRCTDSIKQLNRPTHSNDRVYGIDGLSPTLNTMQGGNRQPFIAATRGRYDENGKINQQLEPRHDGLSNTLTSVEKDNRVFIPEASEKPFIINPYNGKTSEIETGTLGTSCGTSSGMTAQHLYENGSIRRLTPKECERLQGFPDNWTEGISDSQRYKCCGNAVTINVVQAIIEKLIKNNT